MADAQRRPRGMDSCPGPHPETAWKQLSDPLCRACLTALPEPTKRLITVGIPPGAWPAYLSEVLQQARAGKPLERIHVVGRWCPTCKQIAVQPDQHQCSKEA